MREMRVPRMNNLHIIGKLSKGKSFTPNTEAGLFTFLWW